MAHDHVGIPRFIEEGFSLNGQVYKFDLVRNKQYSESIETLGAESRYYDYYVEKKILAEGVEKQFSAFYRAYCKTTDIKLMKSLIDINKALIESFFSFMFMRAKKTLNTINKLSLSAKVFGNINHSELLRIQSIINTNPLRIIGDKYYFYPLINFSHKQFINNSLGFCLMINKKGERTFIIPLNIRVGIVVSGLNEIKNSDCLFIEPQGDYKTDRINQAICKLEKEYGNGFIFGRTKELVSPYIDYINKLK